MGRKRQTFSKNFKARVVLEALREESTIIEQKILILTIYFELQSNIHIISDSCSSLQLFFNI